MQTENKAQIAWNYVWERIVQKYSNFILICKRLAKADFQLSNTKTGFKYFSVCWKLTVNMGI